MPSKEQWIKAFQETADKYTDEKNIEHYSNNIYCEMCRLCHDDCERCIYRMFESEDEVYCTSIVNAPEIPFFMSRNHVMKMADLRRKWLLDTAIPFVESLPDNKIKQLGE